MVATHIKALSKDVEPLFTAEDIKKMRKFSRQKGVDVFNMLARSLAPTIHGHHYIKKAVLCMLLGGTEKVNLPCYMNKHVYLVVFDLIPWQIHSDS